MSESGKDQIPCRFHLDRLIKWEKSDIFPTQKTKNLYKKAVLREYYAYLIYERKIES